MLETLRAYSDHGFGRRRTAAALHIHPNTLDYRLRRMTVLTGLDPARPADLLTLQAALLVRRDAASGTGPAGRTHGSRRPVT
ncbi:helix-turn-helix domain-containing protein [Actinomadura sp. J1-007]|uniref:PucR family transcriptional regulator n=1 Tax=Actinomadura sp. J1-007 TaxID=2661913 RepID=UPI0028162386|nr:helix-turn-helix domain-containing protein [Actinomadura sp. J1-007]